MYQVHWAETALNELAALWLEADSGMREAITLAAAEIDLQLSHSPTDVGESRPSHRRIAFVTPLAVVFRVDVLARRTVVLHAWSIAR
jgi:hypothetical protein